MTSSLLLTEATQSMEMTQSLQKKVRGPESEEDRKGKMAEKLRGMSIKERCLLVERAIYVEDELQEVPLEFHDMWDYMEEISEVEKCKILAKKAGKQAQGGGGWPSIAARLP